MEKILAAIVLILIIWFGYPHMRRGEWLAPTAIAPGSWVEGATFPEHRDMLAQPPEGYGWYRFDFWNNPPATGRPVKGLKIGT